MLMLTYDIWQPSLYSTRLKMTTLKKQLTVWWMMRVVILGFYSGLWRPMMLSLSLMVQELSAKTSWPVL